MHELIERYSHLNMSRTYVSILAQEGIEIHIMNNDNTQLRLVMILVVIMIMAHYECYVGTIHLTKVWVFESVCMYVSIENDYFSIGKYVINSKLYSSFSVLKQLDK